MRQSPMDAIILVTLAHGDLSHARTIGFHRRGHGSDLVRSDGNPRRISTAVRSVFRNEGRQGLPKSSTLTALSAEANRRTRVSVFWPPACQDVSVRTGFPSPRSRMCRCCCTVTVIQVGLRYLSQHDFFQVRGKTASVRNRGSLQTYKSDCASLGILLEKKKKKIAPDKPTSLRAAARDLFAETPKENRPRSGFLSFSDLVRYFTSDIEALLRVAVCVRVMERY